MKRLIEQNRERLTARERERVWNRIEMRRRRADRSPPNRAIAYAMIGIVLALAGATVILIQNPTGIEQPQTIAERIDPSPLSEQTTRSTARGATQKQVADTSLSDEPRAARASTTQGVAALADTIRTPSVRATPEPQTIRPAVVHTTASKTGRIEGIVTDDLGSPLAYVNVVILGTAWGAMTNEKGEFVIKYVPPGDYSLKAMVIGYEESEVVNISLDPDRSVHLDFAMNQKIVGTMDLVEITSSRQRIKLKGATRGRDLKNLPVDEVSELIGLKAGVVAQGGQLHFRGGRGGEVQYQVDGGPVRDPSLVGASPTPSSPSGPSPLDFKVGNRNSGRPRPPVVPTTGGTTLPNDEVFDSMFFEHYGVNPFIATDEDSLSTFAIDVDTGSYTVSRRYIELGHLPPKDAVRVEEFINYFDQDYPIFYESDFRILVDGCPSPFGSGYQLLRIGLKGREIDTKDRLPANLVFVIDISGSMSRENRLQLVKKALHILTAQLKPADRVGIVVYGNRGEKHLEPTSIDNRKTITEAIDRLCPRGSTNAEEGLLLGYEMARSIYQVDRINRIILCSDGVANVGRTGSESILERVRREADEGIHLTTVGFGMGNYNDALMEQLADQGDGSYYYVDDLDEATRIFKENLTGTLQTIAKDAKIQVEFAPERVLRYRLLGFENRDVADRDFRNDVIDAGEIGAGHEVTALYEVKLAEHVKEGTIATVRFRYAQPEDEASGVPEVREIEHGFDAHDLAAAFEEAPTRLRLDATVAEFAEILRHSFWAKESKLTDLLSLARHVADDLEEDAAAQELVELIEKAADQSEKLSQEEREEVEVEESRER